jgi:amino acid transporter
MTLALIGVFIYLYYKKDTLTYFRQGKWWLTWFSVAIITLMDELTSIFYAPAEAFRFIGLNAIFFIIFTSVLIRFLSTRMVEIAEILERNNVKGGGVYSFSYIVLGPTISFIAVASIMLDYILTAAISSVSAVENGLSLFPILHGGHFAIALIFIWLIAGLNIAGIRENARFTYNIFAVAMIVILNLVLSSFLKTDTQTWAGMLGSMKHTVIQFNGQHGIPIMYLIFIGSISSCILAYSGIESVIQSAGYVRNWKDIRKAYLFLAVTVGIITPLISAFALSSGVDLKLHETDLITFFATKLNGVVFGMVVGLLASVILVMAVNTAMVASSELLEKVCERYGFTWFIKTNSKNSLYRIHIINAALYSLVIIFTSGSQKLLAEMYALGLLASFCINVLCLLIYRYSHGTKEISEYHTSRVGTLVLFAILFSCFVWLAYHKVYGTVLWLSLCTFFISVGLFVAKKRSPEIGEIQQTDTPMDVLLYMSESKAENINLHFLRSTEKYFDYEPDRDVLISYYSPREGISPKMGPNHFRIQISGQSLANSIAATLDMIDYEQIEGKKITVHFGWPMSSWWDRLSTSVMVFNLMKLPRMFPRFNFRMEYFVRKDTVTRPKGRN